jgi:hypothetical protein
VGRKSSGKRGTGEGWQLRRRPARGKEGTSRGEMIPGKTRITAHGLAGGDIGDGEDGKPWGCVLHRRLIVPQQERLTPLTEEPKRLTVVAVELTEYGRRNSEAEERVDHSTWLLVPIAGSRRQTWRSALWTRPSRKELWTSKSRSSSRKGPTKESGMMHIARYRSVPSPLSGGRSSSSWIGGGQPSGPRAYAAC